jgi:hypothetical protein
MNQYCKGGKDRRCPEEDEEGRTNARENGGDSSVLLVTSFGT